jgi:hypothetical protein
MRHSYAREKFGVAVNSLATGTSDLNDRIWNAYLSFHTLTENDFPDELKEDWLEIHNSLTVEEPTYDEKGEVTIGKVQNTLKSLDTESCVELAQKICDLNTMLHLDK